MAAKTSDWRKEGQRKELRSVMKGAGFCLNIAGFICFFGSILVGHIRTYWTIICAALLFISLILYLMNHQSGDNETCVVTDVDYHRGGCRNISTYHCTVEINDGTEIRLPITRKIYRDLEFGDKVLVYIGTGAFGIEYAYFAGTSG